MIDTTIRNTHSHLASNDYNIQHQLLPGVSRTFALTIPQLPATLYHVVSNAYLLCRIVDTIEDDPTLPLTQKTELIQQFITTVRGKTNSEELVNILLHHLSTNTPAPERTLIQNISAVIRCLRSFNNRQQRCIEQCVSIMSHGMLRFQHHASVAGLADLNEMNRYCYYVAGVVGEMLTELFCDYSAAIEQHYQRLMPLAVSFGQALQMTNIIKDVWEDRQRGMCWYPRQLFERRGIDLNHLNTQHHLTGFEQGVKELIAIAMGHLRNALEYTLLLPHTETGIRRFCLWALNLAIMTLRKAHKHPHFTAGTQVKVSRRTLKATISTTSLCAKSNNMLRCLFTALTIGLPSTSQPTTGLFTEWFDYE